MIPVIIDARLNKRMLIKYTEKESASLPSKGTHINADHSQILNDTALPPEARSPHIFEDTGCDENVAYSARASNWYYQLAI